MAVCNFGSMPLHKYLSCHGGIKAYLRVTSVVSVFESSGQIKVLFSGSVEHRVDFLLD